MAGERTDSRPGRLGAVHKIGKELKSFLNGLRASERSLPVAQAIGFVLAKETTAIVHSGIILPKT
jgi:hypothetical protein